MVPAADAPEGPLSTDWTFTLGGHSGAARPVATADRVYAHEMNSVLYAIDAATGDEVWARAVDEPRGSLAVGDEVAVALTESTVLGLDPETGERRWTGPESHAGLFQRGPAVADGTAYVPVDLSLLALDLADGTVEWEHTTGEETVATPAVVGDTAYYGDEDTYVYALDAATGRERWRYKTAGRVECNVAVADGTVFAGSEDGTLHALDAATGDRHWTYDLQSPPAAIASDGAHAYVGAGATLRAIEAVTGDRCWSTGYQDSYASGIAVGGGRVYAPLPRTRSPDEGLPAVLDAATGDVRARTKGAFESASAQFSQGPAVVDGAVYASGVDEGGITLARFS